MQYVNLDRPKLSQTGFCYQDYEKRSTLSGLIQTFKNVSVPKLKVTLIFCPLVHTMLFLHCKCSTEAAFKLNNAAQMTRINKKIKIELIL